MPMYDLECDNGHQTEMLTAIEDRHPACRECGAPTMRIWLRTSNGVIGDAMDYIEENLGPVPIHITSRSQRKRLMAQRGVREMIRHTDGDQHNKRWI